MMKQAPSFSVATPLLAAACRGRRSGVIVNEHVLSAAQARRHVEQLSRWFDFIHHDQLNERLGGRRGRPFCLMTFDDGRQSNYLEVAPVLERLGIPAAFYLVTGRVSDGRPFWFDRHAALVKALGRAPAGLELSRLKALPYGRICEVLDKACSSHGVADESIDRGALSMSWVQARDLVRRGFTIGAHGVNHVIATVQSELEAQDEIARSMETVTAQIGKPCPTFAFPNGSYTRSLAEFVRRGGARTVMTTDPLWVDANSSLWMLPRVQLFAENSPMKIEAKLALAAIGRCLPNPDGTGRRYARLRPRPTPLTAEPEAR